MNIPEGWKLVPIEPTAEMMEVYKRWHEQGRGYMNISVWKAMLAVAPYPPLPAPDVPSQNPLSEK